MERLGKNHGGYHGETIDIRAVLRDVELAALQRTAGLPKRLASKANSTCSHFTALAATKRSEGGFTFPPAFTGTSRPARSPGCVCFRKTNGRKTRNFGSVLV